MKSSVELLAPEHRQSSTLSRFNHDAIGKLSALIVLLLLLHYTRLTALIQDYPGEPVPEMQNQSGFYRSKRQSVAVASAGPYESLHIAPDRQLRQHPTTRFLQA